MSDERRRGKRGSCYVVAPEHSTTYIYGVYPYTDEGKHQAEEHIEKLRESEGGDYEIKIK